MGTGNYHHKDGITVILDLYEGVYEVAQDDVDMAIILKDELFIDFKEDLETVLAQTTFQMDGKQWRNDSRDCQILAENNLYQIWSHQDSYDHVYLTYGISENLPDDMEGLARHHLHMRANAFFDRLQKLHDLRVATSPWTSAPRQCATDVAAAV